MEIVSSAPSQPVVPLVELSSDDEIEKPHESDDDDEEESGPFEQTETKPLKLPSGVIIKVVIKVPEAVTFSFLFKLILYRRERNAISDSCICMESCAWFFVF